MDTPLFTHFAHKLALEELFPQNCIVKSLIADGSKLSNDLASYIVNPFISHLTCAISLGLYKMTENFNLQVL